MKSITYSTILKRKISLKCAPDDIITENCILNKNRMYKSGSLEDATKFITECASNSDACTRFILNISDAVYKHSDDRKLLDIFENSILPNIKSGYNFIPTNEMPISDEDKNIIREQLLINNNCDRILENYDSISRAFNIDEFTEINSPDMIVEKVCSIIAKYPPLPTHGKINIALESAMFAMDKCAKHYNRKDIIKIAENYFFIRDNNIDYDKVSKTIRENRYIHESDGDTDNNCTKPVQLFMISPIKTPELLMDTLKDLLNNPDYELRISIESYLYLLRQIMISSQDNELTQSVYTTIIPAIYDLFYNSRLNSTILNIIANDIKDVIASEIEEARLYLTKFEDIDVNNNMNYYISALKECYEKFVDLTAMAYTEYDVNIMQEGVIGLTAGLLSKAGHGIAKAANKVSVAIKDYRPNNLIANVLAIDKYLANKLSVNNSKAVGNIKKLKAKIFEDSNIYDMVTPEGNIDYIACSYSTDSTDSKELHELFSGYCKDINNSILLNTDYKCYYTIACNEVSIHIKDMVSQIALTEEDRNILENYISTDDRNKIDTIMNIASHNEISFDADDAIKYFSECTDPDLFGLFIEACSYMGINEDTVKSIYDGMISHSEFAIPLRMQYESVIDNYAPQCNDPIIVIEAANIIDHMLYESSDDNDEDFDEDDDFGDGDDEEDEKPKQKAPTPHKSSNSGKPSPANVVNNVKNNTNAIKNIASNVKNNAEVVGSTLSNNVKKSVDKIKHNAGVAKKVLAHEDAKPQANNNQQQPKKLKNAFSGINMNSITLAMKGLRENIRDLSSKEQNMSRNMDAAMDTFARNIKTAVSQDRREAIIKGQVIPSFSKCIKMFIPLAGIAAIGHPEISIIAAFAGLAMSKHLDKRERNLMLDDLDVELQILDKEIQEADSRGQMKKLRALMRTKKEMQRQYQRIKYNLRIGKDILPSSDIGVGSSDNNNY